MNRDHSVIFGIIPKYCVLDSFVDKVMSLIFNMLNIDILGISKLKWTGMGEFNSDDHYIYYCGQESLRRNGVALMVTKESEMQYLDVISKMTE